MMGRYKEGGQERRTAAEKLDFSRQSTQQGREGGAAGTERGCRKKCFGGSDETASPFVFRVLSFVKPPSPWSA